MVWILKRQRALSLFGRISIFRLSAHYILIGGFTEDQQSAIVRNVLLKCLNACNIQLLFCRLAIFSFGFKEGCLSAHWLSPTSSLAQLQARPDHANHHHQHRNYKCCHHDFQSRETSWGCWTLICLSWLAKKHKEASWAPFLVLECHHCSDTDFSSPHTPTIRPNLSHQLDHELIVETSHQGAVPLNNVSQLCDHNGYHK